MTTAWPYERWEDYRAGMYAVRYTNSDTGASDAAALLANPDRCWAAMSAVVREWPVATEHNLTDLGQNRRAWLGQAAACFELGVPQDVTGTGWWQLTDLQRLEANAIADRVIVEWESERTADGRLF